MKNFTRRLLVPIDWQTGKVGRGFLLPDLRPAQRAAFVRIPGGRQMSHGMVAFVRPAVTAGDLLARWKKTVAVVEGDERALDELEGYVRWVAQQPLGAIFQASYDSRGTLSANKVANGPPVRRVPIPD